MKSLPYSLRTAFWILLPPCFQRHGTPDSKPCERKFHKTQQRHHKVHRVLLTPNQSKCSDNFELAFALASVATKMSKAGYPVFWSSETTSSIQSMRFCSDHNMNLLPEHPGTGQNHYSFKGAGGIEFIAFVHSGLFVGTFL